MAPLKKRPFMRVLNEGIIAGILLIIFFYLAQVVVDLTGLFEVKLPEACNRWNDKYVLEATLMLSVLFVQFASEYSGLNQWYAENF